MKYTTILFDLDGTLTDPEQGICGSVRYALEKAGKPVGPIESYHKYIGPPLLRSFEVYANATPEEDKQLLDFYRERFSTGTRLAVATGKPTVFSEQILEHFGLLQYFDIVSGIPLDREPPDKCEVILHALYEMGISDRTGCVMVGDRSHDAIGAKMARIDFIGVLYGYGSREELEVEGSGILAESVAALRSLLLN